MMIESDVVDRMKVIANERGMSLDDLVTMMIGVTLEEPDWLIAASEHIVSSREG